MLRALETLDDGTVWIDTRHVVAIYADEKNNTRMTISTGFNLGWHFVKTPDQLALHLQEPG